MMIPSREKPSAPADTKRMTGLHPERNAPFIFVVACWGCYTHEKIQLNTLGCAARNPNLSQVCRSRLEVSTE